MFKKFLLLLCLLPGVIIYASGQDLYEKLDSLMAVYVQSIRTEDEESKAEMRRRMDAWQKMSPDFILKK